MKSSLEPLKTTSLREERLALSKWIGIAFNFDAESIGIIDNSTYE